jgi:hypothetical protein
MQAQMYAQNNLTPIKDNLTGAQELCLVVVSKIEIPEIQYTPVEPPKYWTNGLLTQIGFSQVSLTNWAEGGSGSIAMNAFLDGNANYARGKMIWENRIKGSYGFIQSFGDHYKKSDDKIQLGSKWGYKAIEKLYFSADFNFRTQFSPGYTYSGDVKTLQSSFFAPAYMSLGLGIDYKPFKSLSINFAPLTGNFVIVGIKELRAKYGNKEDEGIRTELGAQLKAEFKTSYKIFSVGTVLTLFSNFLHNPQNIQVYWDFDLGFKVAKFFTIGLRTNLIYDDNILIADKNGENLAPRVQFKENLSVNFTYVFGKYLKAK